MNPQSAIPTEEAHEELKARFANPIVSAFVISWVLWNWKPLVVLFLGSEKPTSRIADAVLYFGWAKGLGLPFLTAVLFLFVISPVGGMVPRVVSILWAKANAKLENWNNEEQNRILDLRIERWMNEAPATMQEWASSLNHREKKIRDETHWCHMRKKELTQQEVDLSGRVAQAEKLKKEADEAQIELVHRIVQGITRDHYVTSTVGSAMADQVFRIFTSEEYARKLVKPPS